MKKQILKLVVFVLVSAQVYSENLFGGIKIAFLEGFSGQDPNTARELYRGVESFFDVYPDAKQRLAIEKFDTKGNVEEAYKAAKSAVSNGTEVLLGVSKSDEALAVASAAEEMRVPFITPYATHETITAGRNWIFQTCFSDVRQSKALAGYLIEALRPSRVLITVNDAQKYSINLSSRVRDILKHNRAILIQEFHYQGDSISLTELSKVVRAFSPNVVFSPDHIIRASLLVREINRVRPEVVFLGSDGWGGKKTFRGVVGEIGKLKMYYTTHWGEGFRSRENKKFSQAYRCKICG